MRAKLTPSLFLKKGLGVGVCVDVQESEARWRRATVGSGQQTLHKRQHRNETLTLSPSCYALDVVLHFARVKQRSSVE